MPLWIARIAKGLFRLSYYPFRLLKKQHKTVFLSRQADQPNLDFELLLAELHRHDPTMQTVCCCKRIRPGVKHKLAYLLHLVACMYHLATSTHCVTDSYSIPLSLLPHKNLRTMQIWHALCAIKCFGYQTLDRTAGTSRRLALLMEMHRGYDLILAPGELVASHFAEAFCAPREKIHLLGMPRIDYLMTAHPKRQQYLLQAYPALAKKQNVLYTPTFRKGQAVDLADVVATFDFAQYNLVIHRHVLDEPDSEGGTGAGQAVVVNDPAVSVFDLYQLCDCMVTDYSATALEFSLLRKPVYFYVYDYEAYASDPGLNIDVRAEFPAYTAERFGDIMEMIRSESYDLAVVDAFRERYVSAPLDGSCTERIVALLLGEKDSLSLGE